MFLIFVQDLHVHLVHQEETQEQDHLQTGPSLGAMVNISIYLSTNLYGSLSRDYVSKLLRNEAAQTQNPYVILIPY